MGNGTVMRKAHLTENLCPRPCFYLCRDVDGFEGRDGDDKAIPGPARRIANEPTNETCMTVN